MPRPPALAGAVLVAVLALPVPRTMEGADAPPVSAAYSVANTSPLALQQPLPGLGEAERARFDQGRALFNQIWVASPSIDTAFDGLGPTFNQSSCAACHPRNGRGQPPLLPQERPRGLLVRLSIPGTAANGGPLPHPVYGEQLQDNAVTGISAEGRVAVEWVGQIEYFADGESIALRSPRMTFVNLAFGEPGPELLLSARVAPQIVGAGLLDAVPDSALEALAMQVRPDGISGRSNRVYDPVSGRVRSGRFGWKANAASLAQQTASAFSGDLGITSAHFPQENCPSAQTACQGAPAASPDLTEQQLAAIVFHQSALAVPAPRGPDAATVQRGRSLFDAAGCQHCHVPELESAPEAMLPALASQRFAAYTDLLLHDMGEGLADGRPDFLASGSEWRTAPLWGIGLLETVNEHQLLLHDGRARGVLEAIMWHGGEAEAARERVRDMNGAERDALVLFINSL